MNSIDRREDPDEEEDEGITKLLRYHEIRPRLHLAPFHSNKQVTLKEMKSMMKKREKRKVEKGAKSTPTCCRMFQATRAYMTATKAMQR